MLYTVVASMRNEGPFIVEWVAWYRMLGFTNIVVVTNDCTDHSPALLDALADAGWLHHIRHDVPDGIRICAKKLAAAHATRIVRRSDWVMVCDVDEFLVIHRGTGQIADLIETTTPSFTGMSINWRVFGTGGQTAWQDGLTHRQFTRAGHLAHRLSRWTKAIHSLPKRFEALGEHGPRRLTLKGDETWGQPPFRWVNSRGETVPQWRPSTAPYLQALTAPQSGFEVAQINHYMLRSTESFSLKRGTLSSVQGVDRYTEDYFHTADRNEVEDRSALRYSAAFDALHAEAKALPDVSRLHHLCCMEYVERLCAKAGRPRAEDPRWHWHREQAGV